MKVEVQEPNVIKLLLNFEKLSEREKGYIVGISEGLAKNNEHKEEKEKGA